MNKVEILVVENGMRSYVTFRVVGDIWGWLKTNNNGQARITSEVMDLVNGSQEKEFMYESQLNKFLKRFKDLKNIEIKKTLT